MFLQAPSSATDAGIVSFRDLVDFVAHLADCYPAFTSSFPDQLIEILTTHHRDLEPVLREKIAGSLVLLRKKDIIDSSRCAEMTREWNDMKLMHIVKTLADPIPYTYFNT